MPYDKGRFFAYLRLMRLHQPVGTLLLLWPCWWAAALASPGPPDLAVLFWFAAGALCMRSAGCIVNDIADRNFDAQVERTRSRPLASGAIGVHEACMLLALLLALAFCIALALGPVAIVWGALALGPAAVYPLMKRVSWWPQLFLGMAFNWGALMGWATVRQGLIAPEAIALYVGGVCWTLGYDTIYAHQDRRDDARIGVKSLALRLGAHTLPAVAGFYAAALLFWALAGWIAGASVWLALFLGAAALHMAWQLYTVNLDRPSSCRRVFASNAWLGGALFIGFLAGNLLL